MPGNRYDFLTINSLYNAYQEAAAKIAARQNLKTKTMRTDNKNSEKDLNANPESRLNTNKPLARPGKFPESRQARDEMKKKAHKKKDDDIELLAADVEGTVGIRKTSSSPDDIAGVADLDRGMRRARRKP